MLITYPFNPNHNHRPSAIVKVTKPSRKFWESALVFQSPYEFAKLVHYDIIRKSQIK